MSSKSPKTDTKKREQKPSKWFIDNGFTKADPAYTNGYAIWLHPETNDVLNQYGQKLTLCLRPKEKFHKTSAQYLELSCRYGSMYLARLKYITFVGEIKPGHTIDHIDGNSLNNDIRNLRAVPHEINFRDGGFLRKLRNKGIIVANYPGIILEGYKRMAEWKSTHKEYAYKHLTRTELLQIFLGDDYSLDPRSTDDIMLAEMSRHMEL